MQSRPLVLPLHEGDAAVIAADPTYERLTRARCFYPAEAPFRHMVTRGGFRMSVVMTDCGALGWVSDRDCRSNTNRADLTTRAAGWLLMWLLCSTNEAGTQPSIRKIK